MHLQIGSVPPYEQPWPNTDCMYDHGNQSPERTDMSDDSSHATHNELRSPQPIHQVPYGNTGEYAQQSHLNTELFHGGSLASDLLTPSQNITLRELEYEHHEPEVTVEEREHMDTKPDFDYEHEPTYPKPEPVIEVYPTYTDSGMRNSHRDAESVQFMTPSDEEDSDYKPDSSKPKKRRRSSASSSRTTPRRRSHTHKPSTASTASRPSRVVKKTRGAKASHASDGDDRPFPCPMARYGCPSNFASKNEWKRHVATQHVKLGFYRCDLCSTTHDAHDSTTIYHNDFNRKDLFASHLRRMHFPKLASKQDSTPKARDAEEAEHTKRCYQALRLPPPQSECLFCEKGFSGKASWEERMEHVGRHLEKDSVNLDWKSWRADGALEEYFLQEGLVVRARDGGWKLGDGKPRRGALGRGYEGGDE
ncbi:hypothetical protein P154DRAFT_442888 [Amniculicola lignicola CBS 123094]|uniref:C2H2-type domain-containing protein n=1 Tax=Amniculicola lignicola CBS 123094 TaxID=1392246 RepID=A0A6A5WGF3_9PLEO|nr:hypothetical protein P154DRAFT_442888 [Amniculicola lignicola CBS 123094]